MHPVRSIAFTITTAALAAAFGLPQGAPAKGDDEKPITEDDRAHWSFRSPERPPLPDIGVADSEPGLNPVDRFVLAALRESGLGFAPSADRRTLIRRVTFDLTGLPPEPGEVEAFLLDRDDGAFGRVVDRLLASPAYGERWAQHWLDVARFAESDGFEFDHERKEAWRYRDWVIDALNRDVPYDRFVQLQLAADEIAPGDEAARAATGFLMAGPDMIDINLAEERRHEFLNHMTRTVGEAFLGLTLGCAQCHEHKTDPVSIQDFYRFRALFANTVVEPKKSKQLAPFVREPGSEPPASYVMEAGDFRRRGSEIDPGFLRVLNPDGRAVSPPAAGAESSGRRAELARWMTEGSHPLTGRVIVNRLWMHHFGRALVANPNDFGRTGGRPSHPELLDWLADELPRRGWSLKSMHRLLVTSRTYRQASRGEGTGWDERLEVDPDNALLSRMPRRRLDGEEVRDSFLAAAGLLNREAGGPSVRPPLPPEVTSTLLKNQWKVTEDETGHDRRSIYVFVRRNLRFPLFETFDRPDTNVSCPRRNRSTTPVQALTLLNSAFSLRVAEALAARAGTAGPPDRQVEALYGYLLGRPPSDRDLATARELVEGESGNLTDLALALLNSNEAIYVD